MRVCLCLCDARPPLCPRPQGYKLVATGHKFGGLVAHLFATRVLLQLHQEVAQARAMGINLSFNLADNKASGPLGSAGCACRSYAEEWERPAPWWCGFR